MAYFHQRRTTDADPSHRIMSNIQTLISSIEDLKSLMLKSNDVISTALDVIKRDLDSKEQSVEQTALKFVDFFSEELSKNISGGKLFVAKMNFIRQNYDRHCYQSLTPIYIELINKPAEGWAQRRQLLLTASAIWRYTFHGRDYTLKSQIEAAMECSDCGKFVRPMVERMIEEKIWK